MGYFKKIYLNKFRSFDSYNLEFSEKVNVFYGNNGSGKTNLLESISLFSKGRGLKKDTISNMIKKGNNAFTLQSEFNNEDVIYYLKCKSENKNSKFKKKLYINEDASKNLQENLYALAPFLIFLPETERLFISSPSIRRNFIDRFIFAHDSNYNRLVNEYNKNILERSKLLSNSKYDYDWISLIEKKIATLGNNIYGSRKVELKKILEYLNYYLDEFKLPFEISVDLSDNFYNRNQSEEIFAKELKLNREIDSILGGCKIGPHKSDYLFVNKKDIVVSQLSTGQQKTIILLIYLSKCKFLIDCFNIKPILLLDEVCSHLDKNNRDILLTLVESFDLQIFMTGTNKNLFSFLSTNSNFCNITS